MFVRDERIGLLLIAKEVYFMIAKLWAQEIMDKENPEEAKALYTRVPRLLKDKVKQILIDSGMEKIVTE